MRREVAWLASAPLPLKLLRSPLPLLGKLLGTGTACYSLRTQTVPDQVVVMEAHVERAWALTEILLKMREVWCKFEADGMALSELPSPPADFLTKVPQHASLPANLTSFPATQPDAAKPDLPDEGSMPIPRPCKIGKELDKALAIGFGPEGASVQVPKSYLSDCAIFR